MIYEKLFLDKIKEVFVNEETTAKLIQHQKDGLRALYLQYTKKKPGYILNYPTNAGKRKQVAIFLSTIKHLIEQPIFIICNDVQKWNNTFRNWTDDATYIAINSVKLSVDKKIFISSQDEALAISRREWSIVVVEGMEYTAKFFNQLKGLTAGFKIVVTSVDLKNNYKAFSTIYQWIDPKEKVALEKISKQIEGKRSALEREILLDYYFRDKVLRRRDVLDVSEDCVEDQPKTRNKLPPPTKPVPKKNKDATGTKVKRSKPKPVEESSSDTPSDSSRFEFDTMSAPYTSKLENVEVNSGIEKSRHDLDKRNDNNDSSEVATDYTKGSKRKRARIIESDDESQQHDIASPQKVLNTKTECGKETREEDLRTKHFESFSYHNMNHEEESIQRNSVYFNKVVSLPENSQDVFMQDPVIEQRNNLKSKNENNEESVSSQNHNEVMEISPDLFSTNEIEKIITGPSSVTESRGCPAEALIESDKSANITQENASPNVIENIKNGEEIMTNSKLTKKDEFKNEIEPIKRNTDEINKSDIASIEETCNRAKSSIFDEKMKALEEKTFTKFNGSVLDCLF